MADLPVKRDSRTGTRSYRSPKREQKARETRKRIRDAATTLFLSDGYAGTTMTAIARAAGVGDRTVYLAFATKPALLAEIIKVAVRGDEDDAPLAVRDAWKQVLAAPGDEVLARFAQVATAILERTAPVLEIAEVAATSDPEIAAQRDQGHRNMRSDFREIADALSRAGALAEGVTTEHATDSIYALASHDTYLRLTRGCGWTPARYAAWLRDTLSATLRRPAPRR